MYEIPDVVFSEFLLRLMLSLLLALDEAGADSLNLNIMFLGI